MLKQRRNEENAIRRDMLFLAQCGAASTLAAYARVVPLSERLRSEARGISAEVARTWDKEGRKDPSFFARAAVIHASNSPRIRQGLGSGPEEFSTDFHALLGSNHPLAVRALLLSWEYLSSGQRLDSLYSLEFFGLFGEAAVLAKSILAKVSPDTKYVPARILLPRLEIECVAGGFLVFNREYDHQSGTVGISLLPAGEYAPNYSLLNPDYLMKRIREPATKSHVLGIKDEGEVVSDQLRCVDWLRFLGAHEMVLGAIDIIGNKGLASLPVDFPLIRAEMLLLSGKIRGALEEIDFQRKLIGGQQ